MSQEKKAFVVMHLLPPAIAWIIILIIQTNFPDTVSNPNISTYYILFLVVQGFVALWSVYCIGRLIHLFTAKNPSE